MNILKICRNAGINSFLLCGFFISSASFALQPNDAAQVNKLIDAFKSNNLERISDLISYPLEREAPLTDIQNRQEFIARFDEVIDANLYTRITSSNIEQDWNDIGWRGIILGDGVVTVDHDGNILSINHKTALSQQLSQQEGAKGRRSLQRSVDGFAGPILEWQTQRFHILVDDIGNGNLRYTAWSKGKQLIERPDIVLTNGRLTTDSSGRNKRYIFNNGNFSYQLKVNSVRSNVASAGLLEVYKGTQRILSEVARDIGRNRR